MDIKNADIRLQLAGPGLCSYISLQFLFAIGWSSSRGLLMADRHTMEPGKLGNDLEAYLQCVKVSDEITTSIVDAANSREEISTKSVI